MAGTTGRTMRVSDKEAFRVLGLPLGVDKEAITKKYKSLSIKLSASKSQEDKKRLELVIAAYKRLLPPPPPPPQPPQHHPSHHHHHHLRPSHKGQSGPCNDGDSEGSSEEDGRVLCRNGDARSALSKDAAEMTEEERERRRVEKKRAKKKRQKEKKKLEKIETQILGQKSVNNNNNNNNNRKREESPSEEEEEDEEEEEEEEDEEEGEEGQGIDPNSAFVAAAAAKRGVLGGGLVRERPPRLTPPQPPPAYHHQGPRITSTTAAAATTSNTLRGDGLGQEAVIPDAALVKACQLARRGNEAANVGRYIAAVKLYSDAIALKPNDHRFLGNRSYCLNQLGHHEQALEDAERAVILAPQWDKGHFRRGTSLKDLGRFVEAEAAFEEVLRLDPGCREAQEEVLRVRAARIMEMGFTERQAVSAVAKYSSVQPALDALLAGEFKEVIEDVFRPGNTDDAAKKTRVMGPRDIKMNPLNPEGLTSLWVGNVGPEVTEKSLAQLFASQGQVTSVRLLREKFCAFVNYSDKGAAGRAMAGLQGREFCGQKLLIKFPDNPINSGFHNGSNGSNGGLNNHHHHSLNPNYHGAVRKGNGGVGGVGGGGLPQSSALLSSTGSSAASSSASSSSSSSPAPPPSSSSSSPFVSSSAHKKWV